MAINSLSFFNWRLRAVLTVGWLACTALDEVRVWHLNAPGAIGALSALFCTRLTLVKLGWIRRSVCSRVSEDAARIWTPTNPLIFRLRARCPPEPDKFPRSRIDRVSRRWQAGGMPVSEKPPGASLPFPVMDSSSPYGPKGGDCPWCGASPVHEPNSMAILNGGALMMSVDRQCGQMDPRLDGFLSLIWHGAHDGGRGEWRDCGAEVRIADNCPGGQFEIYFCSTSCLRAFLNDCVDRLERVRSENPPSSTAR
jgi:hypothetical protein